MLAGILLVAAACGGSADPSANNDPECPPAGGYIMGNATISAGADCGYSDLQTGGNLVIEEGGSLHLVGGHVRGNLVLPSGTRVIIDGTTIGGELLISGAPSVEIAHADIGGNLTINAAEGPVSVVSTEVGGNLDINDCTGASVEVRGTTMAGSLQCMNNTGTVTVEDVSVAGSRTGQCAED